MSTTTNNDNLMNNSQFGGSECRAAVVRESNHHED